MSSLKNAMVLLVGCGKMGKDDAHVLNKMQVKYVAVGRSVAGVESFKESTGHDALPGGLDGFLSTWDTPPYKSIFVILCVPNAEVVCAVDSLISAKTNKGMDIRAILLEKTLAVEPGDALAVVNKLLMANLNAFVAFNRRYYPVVQQLKEIIDNSGGTEYVHFEFNEWDERFENAVTSSQISSEEANNWEFVTGCHVIDMAFFLAGGVPVDVNCTSTCGNIPPAEHHVKSSAFGGTATTSSGTLVTWKTYFRRRAPWKVEVVTSLKERYELNPIEKLWKYDSSNNAEEVSRAPRRDLIGLRLGLGEMVEDFILAGMDKHHQTSGLVTLPEYKLYLERVYVKLCKPPRQVVVMIGGGNIAHRYMQGFLNYSDVPPLMYVSEPSLAQQQALLSKLVSENPRSRDLILCTTSPAKNMMPKRANLLLCATGAGHRFSSTIESLSNLDAVDVVLLEKPTFQKISDWEEFLTLTEAKNLAVYSTAGGNLLFSNLFKQLLEWKTQNPNNLIRVRVTGVGWGLCCNSAHWLAHFVTLNKLSSGLTMDATGFILKSQLEGKLLKSKRPGCLEIASGNIQLVHALSGDIVVDLRCAEGDGKTQWHTIEYESSGLWVYYRYGDKDAVVSTCQGTKSVEIDIRYTSQASPHILEQVSCESKLKSCLTLKAVGTFELPLLREFEKHFEKCGVDVSHGVPIS